MKTEIAYFGAGCFWCSEAIFSKLKGVNKVISGYAGGKTEKPSYSSVSTGRTGHAEVVRVEFNPGVISYETLLGVFFQIHDPTTLNSQGEDVGMQYRSIILMTNDEQDKSAKKYLHEIIKSGRYSDPPVTEIKKMTKFYPAEKYHQNYYEQNQNQPYCQVVITPKIKKLFKNFKQLI